MISSSSMVSRSLRAIAMTRISQTTRFFSDPIPRPEPPSLDPAAVSDTLSSYCNDWRRALEFFHWVDSAESSFSHTTDTYNKMLDILGKFFEFDLSWDLIHRMKQNPCSVPNHATFRVMFKRYLSAHLVKEAVETYHRLDEFGLKDETSYCNLIDSLCEYKHVVEAQDLCFWNDKTKNQNSTKICNMVLRGWFRIGWFGKCRDFWEEMDKRGFEKSLHSYSIYMDILCKSGKPWKAVKLYKEMKKKNMRLDVVAYNTVIRAVGLTDGVDFSVRVVREMREDGCEPNVASYNTLVKLYCEKGRFDDAHKVLDEMRHRGCDPDVITYHCFFGSMRSPKEILGLFDRMVGSGVRPRGDTFVMLMRKFGRWGFLRPVMIVWRRMEEIGCSPDEAAYNALIDALIEKGMLDMARKFDEEMLDKGLSPRPRAELGSKRPSTGIDSYMKIYHLLPYDTIMVLS